MSTQGYAVEIPLRWSDMDTFAHVNNVAYLRYLEQARVVAFTEWFEGTGVDLLRTGILVARQEIEYLAQLPYRSHPVLIRMWVPRLSGGSFDIGYEVRDPDGMGDVRYALAETTMVCFDLASEASRPITAEERSIFERFPGPEVPFRRRRGTPPATA